MSTKPPFFDLLSRQFELLTERREALVREIDDIDRKLLSAAKSMGLDPADVSASETFALSPLPRREDRRTKGSMAEFIREFMQNADRGYTRIELKAEVRNADAKFGAMIDNNENGFYNAVSRLLRRDKVLKEIDGVLYDARRAPAPENIVNLFAPSGAKTENGG